MLKKLESKERNIIFIVCIVLSFLLYLIFLQGYYSLDTHRLIKNGYDYYAINDASFNDGRLIMGWICLIFQALNISYIPFYQIMLITAIIISCACVVEIYKIVNHYHTIIKKKNKVFVFLISYLYIYSTFYVNSMEFVENIVMALSIYMFIKAVEYIVIENKYIEGLIFTILGMFSYQGTIPTFVSFAVLISIVENKGFNKRTFKQLTICAVLLIISLLLNELFLNLYNVNGNPRAGNENMFIYLYENLCNIYMLILYSLETFPHYLWVTIILFILVIIIFYCKRIKNIKPLIYVLLIIIFTICGQCLIFFTQEIFYNEQGRIFLAIGSLFSTILIYLYICTNIFQEKNIYKNILFFITIFYFIITLVETVYLQNLYKDGMRIDYNVSKAIEQKVEEGEGVNKICLYYRESTNDIKLKLNDSVKLRSDLVMGYYGITTYRRDTGKDITYNLEVREEEYKKYFEDQNEPVEIKVVGDTVYIGVLL